MIFLSWYSGIIEHHAMVVRERYLASLLIALQIIELKTRDIMIFLQFYVSNKVHCKREQERQRGAREDFD